MARRNIGSGFDDFLAEEGILEEVNVVAAERVREMQTEAQQQKH